MPGMIVGVPIFAVICKFSVRAINNSLKKKGIGEDVVDYYQLTTLAEDASVQTEEK